MAALGEALAPESRSGLVLFLRRGMWGWVRALAVASEALQPICAAKPNPMAFGERTALIHILAAMTASANERRTP